MNSEDKTVPTLEDIYADIGYGKFHICVLIILGTIQLFYATQMIMLTFLGPTLVCEWKINLWELSFISMSIFIGMSIGSTVFGRISDTYGRKVVVLITSSGIFYFSLSCAISASAFWVIITRLLIGFFIGGFSTIFYTFTTEIMTISQRGPSIMYLQIFWSIGSFYVSMLAMTFLNSVGWRIWATMTIAPMVLLFPCLIWLPESPRYLLTHNRLNDAIKVVNKIAKMNNASPISNIKYVVSKKGHFKDVFHHNYIRTTFIMIYICILSGLGYYGFVFSAAVINDIPHRCLQDWHTVYDLSIFTNVSVDNSCCFKHSWEKMKTILITIAGELLTYTIGIIIVNIIPRKLFLQMLLLMTATVYIMLNFCLSPTNVGLLMMFGRGSTGVMLRINLLYISEVYPTSIRSSILGLSNSLVRTGGMFSSLFVNVIMIKHSYFGFTLLYFIIHIIGFILIFFLPYETKDRILTQSVEDDVSTSKVLKSNE